MPQAPIAGVPMVKSRSERSTRSAASSSSTHILHEAVEKHLGLSIPFESMYTKQKQIGNGSFGTVWTVRNNGSGDMFAAKVMDRSKLKVKDDKAVFREVAVLQTLSQHPNIVSLIDFFQCPRFFHVVLELAKGGDLFDRLAKRKFYTERDARSLAKEFLSAISYIHSLGFVHRDMKPENLLLIDTADDVNGLKVGDFGFAKNLADAPPGGLVTRCGTPAFVAPEVISGVPYGKGVDIWGCGVILYLLLGGYPPFQSKDSRELFRKISSADYVFHEKYWDMISVEAKQLISRMLAIDPIKRLTVEEALNSSWMTKKDDASSSLHLTSAITEMQKFNARRKLKGAFHAAKVLTKASFWNSGTVTFMSSKTKLTKENPSSGKRLSYGKVGQTFQDLYTLDKEIRKGSNASVWKGTGKMTGEKFAIKVIKRSKSRIDDGKILTEVAILKSLKHKHVVKILDYFEHQSFYLVMEYVKGGDVFSRIVKNVQYTEKDARGLAKALLEAVAYIHSCRIAHRDLKPQNLLLEETSRNDCVKVADFGFARRVHTPLSLTTRCGTPTYVAPEILKNHPHDESADMWSVGVILYVILVGYPPFIEEDQRVLFSKIRQGNYEFFEADWEGISGEARTMISSLLVVDPSRRSTAEEALQHEWICDMNSNVLDNNNLARSIDGMMRSRETIEVPLSPLPL